MQTNHRGLWRTRPRIAAWVLAVATLSLAVLAAVQSQPPADNSIDQPESKSVKPNHRNDSAAREQMIETQLASRDIDDPQVLKAMREVERHRFVPPDLRDQAYEDRPLPIGFGQTISQPYIVAFMTQILQLKKTDRVLEIGTGSGYQAAVLSRLVDQVYTIEIVPQLAERSRRALAVSEYDNVHVRSGDGYQGWEEQSPFDAIIVTCAPDQIPQPLVDQLADGGRMIIPVGEPNGAQQLILLEKESGELKRRAVLPVRFVPMTGQSR